VSATFQDFCSPPAVDRSGSGGLVARTATMGEPRRSLATATVTVRGKRLNERVQSESIQTGLDSA
jgi:hypothetical protein